MTEQKLRPPFIEADWPTRIEYMNENENFYHSDGLEVVELGQGWVHMVMPVQKRHLNLQGHVHGGWLAALIGQAAGKAGLSYGYFVTPEQVSLNYHNSCAGGVLHAVAKEKNRGKHLGIYTVDVRDEADLLIASGTATLYIQDKQVDFPRERRQISAQDFV